MNGVGSGDVRKWDQYTGWGRLVTSIGMSGVTFDSREGAVTEDAEALLRYLREHATELHLDAGNVVLWACSSNVTAGLPLAMDSSQTASKAAVIYYGATDFKKLRMDVPVLMVRAGDTFDVFDENEISRATIARTLEFMKTNVTASVQREVTNGMTEAAAASAVYRQDWAAAVKSYEALAAIRPGDTELHRNYGNALLEAQESSAARHRGCAQMDREPEGHYTDATPAQFRSGIREAKGQPTIQSGG